MKIKRNKKSYKWFLCGLILVVVLTITLIKGSRAGYKSTATIELTSGVVKYSSYDFNLISMYIDGVEQDKSTILPNTIANYTINENETYCYKGSKSNKDNNAKISINVLGELVIKGISKGSKCILSLNTKINSAKTMSELLNNHYTINTNRSAENKDFNVPFDKTTYGVVYSAPDDDGTSYYFAGNPLDNWVEFGGYYWRIIRINGNGSIRMIYQGRTEDENGKKLEAQATGEETQVGTSAFNEKADDNTYVGFMYGTPSSNTYKETHANTNDSAVKQVLDSWFNNSNIKQGTEYFNKIDLNTGFCGDRQPSSSNTEINGNSGYKSNGTYYGAYVRLRPGDESVSLNTMPVQPTYKCANSNDLYTYKIANKGNKKLENPIGLITADEVSYAGMLANWDGLINITANYLCTKQTFWTMTPFIYNISSDRNYGSVMVVWSNGFLLDGITNLFGIRPVINLRSDVKLTGSGTQLNPYKAID